jgi:hypothetical protein
MKPDRRTQLIMRALVGLSLLSANAAAQQGSVKIECAAVLRTIPITNIPTPYTIPANERPKPSEQADSTTQRCLLFEVPASQLSREIVVFTTDQQAHFSTLLRRGNAPYTASDGTGSFHRLLISPESEEDIRDVTSADAGATILEVRRDDLGDKPADVTIGLANDPLTDDDDDRNSDGRKPWYVGGLSRGQSYRLWLPASRIRSLVEIADCGGPAARRAQLPAYCINENHNKEVYSLISTMVGRDIAQEFSGARRASLSEPMVAFIGIGGKNKIVLLDCRQVQTQENQSHEHTRRCGGWAQPWQLSFERAKFFWAVSIEEDESPFDTAIDVEFRNQPQKVDYEEFDPRVLSDARFTEEMAHSISPLRQNTSLFRTVRVAYRRFRMREAPAAVQVAFTRQGSTYGVRQWVRTFTQASAWRVGFAAGVYVAADPLTRNTVSLQPTYSDAGPNPSANAIAVDTLHRVTFMYFSARWLSFEAKADDALRRKSFWMTALLPTPAFGIALPKPEGYGLMTGLSWRLISDRLYFTLGRKWANEDVLTSGLVDGSRVPIGARLGDITRRQWTGSKTYGVSIELIRFKG